MDRTRVAASRACIEHRCLFNFAASYSDGGYKRLHAYARWFDGHGGAWFAIHPRCSGLMTEFPRNRYFVVASTRLARLYDDWRYLRPLTAAIGQPDLYYAYGIPLYRRVGRVNWFHLSNVLTLNTAGLPVAPLDRLKFHILGRRIRRGLPLADVISAESSHSLGLLAAGGTAHQCVSVNGSDDELGYMSDPGMAVRGDIATVLGTYRYKAPQESWQVFRMLKARNPNLKLMIIGNATALPAPLRRDADVIVRGNLGRSEVVDCLLRSKYYLSATHVENSYNAASEGIFLADESYISDIGPHRELISGSRFERLSLPGVSVPLLHVKRADLSSAGLKAWNTVIADMLTTACHALHRSRAAAEHSRSLAADSVTSLPRRLTPTGTGD